MALVREIAEELGIRLAQQDLEQVAIANDGDLPEGEGGGVEISLYACRTWFGEPACLEGEEIGWIEAEQIPHLAMPPLDYPLATQLLAHLAQKAN